MNPIHASALRSPGVAHGFFTREGGVSEGVYATLNGGVGSSDDPACVAQNRARMAATLGLAPERLLVPYQVHSPDVATVSAPWMERPRCDGIVTATRGLGLGVTGADCGMILFADARAGVIGAAHSGWRGARDGVVEATVAAMVALGALARDVVAVLGPCIAQESYEVGPEFVGAFADDSEAPRCFKPSRNVGRSMFDLHAYIGLRAQRAGVGEFVDLALDTYADEARFFSYRRKTHRGETDYGRLVSAITLL